MDFIFTLGLYGVITFLITVIIMPRLIRYFREEQLGQIIREEGPASHMEKQGTPTMGGVTFIIAVTVASIIYAFVHTTLNPNLILLVLVMLYYAGIGFVDDYLILIKKHNEGITSRQKMALQILGGVFFVGAYFLLGLEAYPVLPFLNEGLVGLVVFALFSIFWLVGFSNAVNLTDGVDGLSSSTVSLAFLYYAYRAFEMQEWAIASFSCMIVGGLWGFFLFNKKPAQIFMGDVGSLSLGAAIAAVAILIGEPLSLLLVGIVFVLETASVILQVFSFQTFGKRIFKMSPLHHHFEMSGFSENQVVALFLVIGLVGAIVANVL